MSYRTIIALTGATVALVLAPAAAPAASIGGTPDVTVRVEGLKRTLLKPTTVNTKPGFITKGDTPSGRCSTTTAAGALDDATRHHWTGTWENTYGTLLLTSVAGESHTLSSKAYWSIWVDGRYAQSGICGLKLHRGEQLLFAAIPDTFTGYPLLLSAPSTATAGKPFTVSVTYINKKGKSAPVAHAHVTAAGVSVFTDSHGHAQVLDQHAGTLTVAADKAGYIRAARERVKVTG